MLFRDSHKLFCHLLRLLIRIYAVFIFPNLQSHAQDAASVKAGLLANTVNEFSTAKMSMVFLFVKKGTNLSSSAALGNFHGNVRAAIRRSEQQ